MKHNKKINSSGFTLIEILIGILIFSGILIGSFQILSFLGIGRAKLIIETTIEKNAFYFSEKLFETIKAGGTIDYEEYFNRKVFNKNKTENTLYLSGHYKENSGFGNKGKIYYCLSGSGTTNDKKLLKNTNPSNPSNGDYYNNGCFDNNLNTIGSTQEGNKQRYSEYAFQFIDYNSDANGDGGDVDGNGNFIGDNDDEFLGRGPKVFTGGTNLPELYLISGDKKTRTYFRYSVKQDPNIPASLHDCNTSDNGKNYTGSGCLGTIEFLKLNGKDWGENHNLTGTGVYDGHIDTWIINKKFSGQTSSNPTKSIIAGSGTTEYWQPLFDDSINVSNLKFFLYPNKDTNLSWKEENSNDTAPYLRLKMNLTPSWKTRKQIKGKIPNIPINMTISLSDILGN